MGARKGSLSSDLSWVPSDRSSGHRTCSCLTSCPLPAQWLALTVSFPLTPWPTLESGLRSQEKPFQLLCVKPALCPTGQMHPCPLLVPLNLGLGRPWGPEEEAEDKRGTVLSCITFRASWSPPTPAVSPHHTPPSALICHMGSKRAHRGTARGQRGWRLRRKEGGRTPFSQGKVTILEGGHLLQPINLEELLGQELPCGGRSQKRSSEQDP